MPDTLSHNQHAISSEFINHLKKTVDKDNFNITDINPLKGFSNSLIQLHLEDGNRIMVKQSDYGWAEPRFESARQASLLLRKKSSLIAPEHIPISEVTETPTIAYWYQHFSTLEDLWPRLSSLQCNQAIEDLGRLLRTMHSIDVQNFGMLHEGHRYESAYSFIIYELNKRLKPAISAHWPSMLPVIDRLLLIAENIFKEKHDDASLIHNDVHMGNILCNIEEERIKCIGFLDLEEARGSRWESDLAKAVTLHSPLFAREGKQKDFLKNYDQILFKGYGKRPQTKLFYFFRVYHLLNLGFFSAYKGDHKHAEWVGQEASQLLKQI